MPNFSGVWNLKDHIQAIGVERWTGLPNRELYAWGDNDFGMLGDGTVVRRSSPVQIGPSGALISWYQVSGGEQHSVAIKTDGTLWSWGRSQSGSLGLGPNSISRSSPVQVGALKNWSQVSAGELFAIATKTDGTLWAWGLQTDGRLGNGTATLSVNSPVQIGALTNWYQVSVGTDHAAAIKTDNTIWAWGSNATGQLGDGTVVNRSSPVQIGALTNWSQVSAGQVHTAAIKTDGTLWAWGEGGNGRLGNSSLLDTSSPVQIGALTNWSQVSAAITHTAAIKTDNTIWAWGSELDGRLGNNARTGAESSPIQIGALTNWSQVAARGTATLSVKTDGTLWAWGLGTLGQTGIDTTTARSSPVQVGTSTNWVQVSKASLSFAFGIFQGKTN